MKASYLLSIIGMFLLLSACRKEEKDEAVIVPSEFVYNGNEHILTGGVLVHYSSISNEQAKRLGVFLHTEHVELKLSDDGFPTGANGNGFILYLECFSSESTYLPNGLFQLDSTLAPFAIAWSSLNPVVNGNTNSWIDCKSVNFESRYEDGSQTLIGNGLDAASRSFTFSYQGSLDRY